MATKQKGAVANPLSRKKTASKKKTAKKLVSQKRAVPKVSNCKSTTSSIGAGSRRKMIAEEAYFLSLQRCSEVGSALEDWLIAEAQVDRKLIGQKG